MTMPDLKFEALPRLPNRLSMLLVALLLTACSSAPPTLPESSEATAASTRAPADIRRINELERQLVVRQRHYMEERRRLELELKESEKRGDELQQKLDAVLAIDRELRRGIKGAE